MQLESGRRFGDLQQVQHVQVFHSALLLALVHGRGDGLEGDEFGLEVGHVDGVLLLLVVVLGLEQVGVAGDPVLK